MNAVEISIFTLLFYTQFYSVVGSNFYISNTGLNDLFEKDLIFTERIERISYKGGPKVETLLRDSQVISQILENELITRETWSDIILNNPLNQFYVLRKFAYQWSKMPAEVERLTSGQLGQMSQKNMAMKKVIDLLEELSEEVKQVQVDGSDVNKAAESIVRLQQFYHIDPEEFVAGKVRNFSAARGMKEDEIRSVMLAAFAKTDFCSTDVWIRVMKKMGLKIPSLVDSVVNKPPTKKSCDEIMCFSGDKECLAHDNLSRNYQGSCNHKTFKLRKSRIRNPPCFLNAPTAASILQPVKTEWVSVNPAVYQLHGVFTPLECDEMWAVGQAKQERSLIVGTEEDGSDEVDDSRVGTNHWADDSNAAIVRDFSRRVFLTTGLQTEKEVEQWQVASYGIGGHYWYHEDYMPRPEDDPFRENGNRFATFMVYLSEVELGGATAFPYLNISFFPEKGSALFWFNMDLSGEVLPITLHGGCSVLLGSKKIGNKWIRYRGQFNTYPCSLNPKAMPKLPPSLVEY